MDTQLYRWVNEVADATTWAHGAAAAFATYGVVLFAMLLVAALVDGWRRGDPHRVATAIWAGGAAIVALGVGSLIGGAVGRPRPFFSIPGAHVLITRSTDVSFPSDHATAVGAIAAGLLLGRHRVAGTIAAVGAVVMAVARVYVGVHYPGDVVAGLALGTTVAAIGIRLVVPLMTRALVATRTPGREHWRGGSQPPEPPRARRHGVPAVLRDPLRVPPRLRGRRRLLRARR